MERANGEDSKEEDLLVVRMVSLGEASVGKTTLATTYSTEVALNVADQDASLYKPTVGMELKTKTLTIPAHDGPVKVKVEIWDPAGREKFRTIAVSYIKPMELILLAFDLTNRESFDKLSYWADLIREQKTEAPPYKVALLGNKADLEEQRKVNKEEAESFALSRGFKYSEVSAVNKMNLPYAIDQLIKESEMFAPQNSDNPTGGRKGTEEDSGPSVYVEFLRGEKLEAILDSISCEALMKKEAQFQKSGYFLKKGHRVKNWKRRFFVLKNEYLYYFETEKSLKPKGFILLRNSTIQRYQDPEQPNLGFEIEVHNSSTEHVQYYMTGLENAQREEWIEIIQNAASSTKIDKSFKEQSKFIEKYFNSLLEITIIPGYIRFKQISFNPFKAKDARYPTRRTKLQLYSDGSLGEDRFLLLDTAEYGTRFIVTPTNKEQFLQYFTEHHIYCKKKIPIQQVLDLFNFTYLHACQTFCLLPIHKVKIAVSDCFTSRSPLTTLPLDQIEISVSDLISLRYALGFCPTVTCLDLTGTRLERDLFMEIDRIIRLPKIKIFALKFSSALSFSFVGQALSDCLKNVPLLTHLDISNNRLGTELSPILTELVNLNSITELNLENIGLIDQYCEVLAAAFSKFSQLNSINISKNSGLTEKGHEKLFDSLKSKSLSQFIFDEPSLSSTLVEKMKDLVIIKKN